MFYTALFIYLLGGLTFIPLLIVSFGLLVYYSSPIVEPNRAIRSSEARLESTQALDQEDHQAKHDIETELPKLYRFGWLTVRKTYESSQSSESGYMGLLTNSYRNFMDQRSKDSKRTRPKDRFYSVLKQNVLFLYQDEDQIDCAAAIQVSLYDVDLYPSGCPDGELFVKRKAIILNPIIQATPHQSPQDPSLPLKPSDPSENPPVDHQSNQPGRPSAWFIFTRNNLEKEDWYHTLLAASKLTGPNSRAVFRKDASVFDSQDMAKLVEGIDQQPDPIPMRWMNAMLGRLFLSAYRTHALEHWIIDRIMKKLAKVQTPNFLSAINVREVNVGSTTPFFSKPMLKELTVDGDASMEVLVDYKGEFRITIETVATINLGARFKPYVVNLVLAVVLKKLSGTLLLKIKRPPTNRLWFGFTSMPDLVFDLEPVVSTRQIKWALVLKPIESRIREVVLESIVYPNLDDLVFFDTQPYIHHGGIWGDAARKENSTNETQADQTSDDSTSADEPKSNNHSSSRSHKKSHSEPHHQTDTPTQNASLSSAREQNPSQDTMRLRTVNKSTNDHVASPETTGLTADEPLVSPTVASFNQSENKRSSWFSSSRRQDTTSTQSSQNSSRIQNKTRSGGQPLESEDGDAIAKLQKFLRTHPECGTPSSSPSNHDGGKTGLSSSVSQQLHGSPRSDSVDVDSETSLVPSKPLETSIKSPNRYAHNEIVQPVANLVHEESNPNTFPSNSGTSSRQESTKPLRRVPPPPHQMLASTFLPPPQRNNPSSLSPLQNVTNPSSTSSILNQLRTRAADKEAIAASVTQARDVVIKWGAAWASKRKSAQGGHVYPYNSGFNPISIDKVPKEDDRNYASTEIRSNTTGSLAETADTTMSADSHQDNANLSNSSGEPYEDDPRSRSHRLDQATHPSNSLSRSDSSTSDDLPLIGLKHQGSHSKLGGHLNPEESSNNKRNRIVSSNGQFIPAAPQTTIGLSITSSSEPMSNHPELKTRLPPALPDRPIPMTMGDPVKPGPDSTTEILSERSIYKPAPMMAIPGIKDSSHRFGIGSDSISQFDPTPGSSSPSITARTDTSTSLGLLDSHQDDSSVHTNEVEKLGPIQPAAYVHDSSEIEGRDDVQAGDDATNDIDVEGQEGLVESNVSRFEGEGEEGVGDPVGSMSRMTDRRSQTTASSGMTDSISEPWNRSTAIAHDGNSSHRGVPSVRDQTLNPVEVVDPSSVVSRDDSLDRGDHDEVQDRVAQDGGDRLESRSNPSMDLDPSCSPDTTEVAWGL